MADHQLRFEPASTSLNGRQSEASSSSTGVSRSALKVGVGAHPPESRKMLDRRADAGGLEPAHIGASAIGRRQRDLGDRALAGHGVEIETIALRTRLEIEHRCEIERDAERGQLAAMGAAELFRFLPRTSGASSASVESGGSHVNGGDRCETTPPSWSAATIKGGRPARRPLSCNAAISALITGGFRLRDIVPGDIDTGDQPLLGKLRDLIEGGIADHEVPAELCANAALGLQHLVLVISNNSCAARIDSGGRQPQHHERICPAKPASSPDTPTSTAARSRTRLVAIQARFSGRATIPEKDRSCTRPASVNAKGREPGEDEGTFGDSHEAPQSSEVLRAAATINAGSRCARARKCVCTNSAKQS